jgi:long-chain acyl-CoA synthetase
VNLAADLVHSASAHADRVALRLGDTRVTYRELDAASERVAGLLRDRGIRPGDRVGVMLPNVMEFTAVYYGVLRAGGVVVPMNPLLKAREVACYLRDSGARLAFVWHGCTDEAQAGTNQAESDAIVVDPATFADVVLAGAQPVAKWWNAGRTTPRSSCTPPAPPASPRVPNSPMPTFPATPRWSPPTCFGSPPTWLPARA